MKIEMLNDPAAGTWARDCILISLSCNKDLRISYHKDEDNTYWELQCENIIAFDLASEEFSSIHLPPEGAFFEILDSSWIAELDNNLFNNFKHFIFSFYDEKIEIICKKIIFNKLTQKPENAP